MRNRTVLEGNAFYELDLDCLENGGICAEEMNGGAEIKNTGQTPPADRGGAGKINRKKRQAPNRAGR